MHLSYVVGYYDALTKLGLYQAAETHIEKCAAASGIEKEAFKRQIINFFSQLAGKGKIVPGTETVKTVSPRLENLKSIFTGKGRIVPGTTPQPAASATAAGTQSTRLTAAQKEKVVADALGKKPAAPAPSAPTAAAPSPPPAQQVAAPAATTTSSRGGALGEALEATTQNPFSRGGAMGEALNVTSKVRGQTMPGAKPWTLGRKLKWGLGLGGAGLAGYHLLGDKPQPGAAGPQQQYGDPYQQMYY